MNDRIRGSCLCGDVKFVISGMPGPIGQCHCSKCRKVSGTDGNAVTRVAPENFAWESGQDLIETYYPEKGSHWHSVFCRQCGSPLPLATEAGNLVFIPAGLLDDDPGQRGYVAHIFVGSKAPWVEITDNSPQFEDNFGSARVSKIPT
jgi:hypothetical protein